MEGGELAVEMGGLVGNLPDSGEIAHPEGFSCGRKGAGVEDDEIEGPGTPQDTPNIEIFEVFEPGSQFASIPVAHEIGAAGEVKISQKVFGKVGERTLAPTKHPPDQPVATSNPNPCEFRVDAIFFDPTCFDDPGRPKMHQRTTLSLSGQWTTLSLSNERRKVCSTTKEEEPAPKLIVDLYQRHALIDHVLRVMGNVS